MAVGSSEVDALFVVTDSKASVNFSAELVSRCPSVRIFGLSYVSVVVLCMCC